VHLVLVIMMLGLSSSMDRGVVDTLIANSASDPENTAKRQDRMSELLRRAVMFAGHNADRGSFPESDEVREFNKRHWGNKQGKAEKGAFRALRQMFPTLVFPLGEGAVALAGNFVENPSAVVEGAGRYIDCFYLVARELEAGAEAMSAALVARDYTLISTVLPAAIGYLQTAINIRERDRYPNASHRRQLQAVKYLHVVAILFADIARIYGPFERRTVDRGSKLIFEGTTSKQSSASSSGSSSKYPCPNGKSTNGRCGIKYGGGMWCENACCSRHGWCGHSDAHCNPDMCERKNKHLSYH
jgi:hypothetical protein